MRATARIAELEAVSPRGDNQGWVSSDQPFTLEMDPDSLSFSDSRVEQSFKAYKAQLQSPQRARVTQREGWAWGALLGALALHVIYVRSTGQWRGRGGTALRRFASLGLWGWSLAMGERHVVATTAPIAGQARAGHSSLQAFMLACLKRLPGVEALLPALQESLCLYPTPHYHIWTYITLESPPCRRD